MPELQSVAFKTKDLAEGALLLAKGQHLNELKWDRDVCWFVFENADTCREISNQFWFGKCPVDAKTFSDSINKLKNRIFSRQ
jgi:hypothetical protein